MDELTTGGIVIVVMGAFKVIEGIMSRITGNGKKCNFDSKASATVDRLDRVVEQLKDCQHEAKIASTEQTGVLRAIHQELRESKISRRN